MNIDDSQHIKDNMKPKKLRYGLANGVRLTVELTEAASHDLAAVQEILQRESDDPSIPITRSVAVRRSLSVYAESLRHLTGRLLGEAGRASSNTYHHERK